MNTFGGWTSEELREIYGVTRKQVVSVNKKNNLLYRYAARRFAINNGLFANIYGGQDQEGMSIVTEKRWIDGANPLDLKWFCYYYENIVPLKIYFSLH